VRNCLTPNGGCSEGRGRAATPDKVRSAATTALHLQVRMNAPSSTPSTASDPASPFSPSPGVGTDQDATAGKLLVLRSSNPGQAAA